MKLLVFSAYDVKLEAYLRPFYCQTKGEALRLWMDTVQKTDHPFNKHPEDFCLFELGEFDEKTGTFNNAHAPISHGNALQYVEKN